MQAKDDDDGDDDDDGGDDRHHGDHDDHDGRPRLPSKQVGREGDRLETESTSLRLVGYASLASATDFRWVHRHDDHRHDHRCLYDDHEIKAIPTFQN